MNHIHHINRKMVLTLSLLTCVLGGCDKKDAQQESAQRVVKPVVAHVMNPVEREVVDYEEFTGRLLPFDEVAVRPQVSGTLLHCTFREDAIIRINPQTGELIPTDGKETENVDENKTESVLREGDEVREGQLLFEIDPRVYETILDSAKSELEVLQARKKRLENDLNRAKRLRPTGAISAEEYDLALFNLQECEAEISVAEAEIQKAQINVNYTKIYAPMDGQLGELEVSVGNLVQGNAMTDSATLVKIVRVDPIYININIDEATSQRLKKIADERKLKNPDADSELTIEFRLSDETEFTHTARVDYMTPTLERGSGTRLIRAICENPKTPSGGRLFQPGMTAHVRIRVTEKYNALLVPEETLGTNQSTRFVYTLTEENMPEMRTVQLGPIQADNMRVIRSGLKPGDRIVKDNLLRIRMDRPVQPMEDKKAE
ncbi:MAG: efflux RND transporter periplasmic adaptor subunit [Planctomycetia bacterium]|nr:efflux RND transporter periplasmic adaptor subunit [Planctomycetia bacterium]